MIRALCTGTLYGDPQTRTSANGKPFTVAKLRADSKDGAAVWCSMIAFGEVGERLASLQQGAALSVSGRIEVSAWINRDGEAAGGLSMMVDELATLKGKPKPRTPKPRQPETAGAGFDDLGDWRS
mgnify:CR=1 FL=1